MSNPAACLAVRDLDVMGVGCLGPGGEVGGSVAVPIHLQPADSAVKAPHPQLHLLRDPATRGACLGRGEPALAYHQVAPEPFGLVLKLSGKLGPGGIGDGSGEAPIAKQVDYRKVLDGQSTVGLGELTRDLVEEALADIGNAVVLAGQQTNGFHPVAGTLLGTRERAVTPA